MQDVKLNKSAMIFEVWCFMNENEDNYNNRLLRLIKHKVILGLSLPNLYRFSILAPLSKVAWRGKMVERCRSNKVC